MDGLNDELITSFLSHMAHSEAIDQNVYCVPPAVQAIRNVAPVLERLVSYMSKVSLLFIFFFFLFIFYIDVLQGYYI